MDYNLQPYNDSGDTSGFRNIKWYKKYVLPIIKEFLNGVAIDLGCGNGRHNLIFHDKFDRIICVDPIVNIDDRFNYDNISYVKSHLHNMPNIKCDVMLMIGSFNILYEHYNDELLNMCKKFLNNNGIILALWEIKQDNFKFNSDIMIDKIKTKDDTSIVAIIKYEDL